MHFGSSYVYLYDDPEFEVISGDELEEGMQISDSDSDEDLSDSRESGTKCSNQKVHNWRNVSSTDLYRTPDPAISGRRERRADTNVVSIDFSNLIAPSHMFTGDPVYCNDCKAILSHISKINRTDDQQDWTCEFCGTINTINVMDEEIPKEQDVTFMLEPALSTTAAGPSGTDESLVIFCIDISGSMSLTSTVPGKLNLKGFNHIRSRKSWYDEDRNVTYVTRLQAAQAAVDHQLEEMAKDHPNRRVALIAFNNEVMVIGDGRDKPVIVRGDRKLEYKNELVKIGKSLKLPGTIKDTRQSLGDQLFSLESHDATALGPALLIANTMATQHPGSKVIICTDGMANLGVGTLDESGRFEREDDGVFYKEVGIEASNKGVTISVVSFKGTDCKLVHLGKLADTTGGQVNIVDPQKLTQEFSNILADRVIATNVEVTFLLHKQLFVLDEDKKKSQVFKQIGNVTSDTEITFEYGIRSVEKQENNLNGKGTVPMETDSKSDHMTTYQNDVIGSRDNNEANASKSQDNSENESSDVSDVLPSTSGNNDNAKFKVDIPEELPFQLQVKYKDTEGATALRVVTQSKPTTLDRKQAEETTNIDVIGAHVQKQVASLVLEGSFTDSRVKAMMNQRLVWRTRKLNKNRPDRKQMRSSYKKIFKNVSKLENRILSAQKRERRERGRSLSASSGEDDDEQQTSVGRRRSRSRSRSRRIRKKALRTKAMSDTFSVAMYQGRQGREVRSRSRSRSRSPGFRRSRFPGISSRRRSRSRSPGFRRGGSPGISSRSRSRTRSPGFRRSRSPGISSRSRSRSRSPGFRRCGSPGISSRSRSRTRSPGFRRSRSRTRSPGFRRSRSPGISSRSRSRSRSPGFRRSPRIRSRRWSAGSRSRSRSAEYRPRSISPRYRSRCRSPY